MIFSEQVVTSNVARNKEKVGVRKIKLSKPAIGIFAMVGSFAIADKFLMAWCSSSTGWFTCKFEVEYLDGYVLKGEYRKYRRKSGRLSLANYIRSAFRTANERSETSPHFIAIIESLQIQLWQGNFPSSMDADFLKRHEVGDFSES